MPNWIALAACLLVAFPTRAAPLLDLPAPGGRVEAKVEAAVARFGEAHKARRLPEAAAAAREAYAAGGGAEALEAVAVTALNPGRPPRAHLLRGVLPRRARHRAAAGRAAARLDVRGSGRAARQPAPLLDLAALRL